MQQNHVVGVSYLEIKDTYIIHATMTGVEGNENDIIGQTNLVLKV
jgi:hypothetical protein